MKLIFSNLSICSRIYSLVSIPRRSSGVEMDFRRTSAAPRTTSPSALSFGVLPSSRPQHPRGTRLQSLPNDRLRTEGVVPESEEVVRCLSATRASEPPEPVSGKVGKSALWNRDVLRPRPNLFPVINAEDSREGTGRGQV